MIRQNPLNMKQSEWSKKYIQLSLHVLVWLVIFSLPYLTDISHTHHIHPVLTPDQEGEFFNLNLCSYLLWVFSFYLNSYVLMPNLFRRNRYVYYAISLFFAFAFVLTIHSLLYKVFITAVPFDLAGSVRFNFPAFFMTVAISISYRLIIEKQKSDKLQIEKQQETMKTELAFLRSQISPHFIMNVLNNIVALSRLKSDELEPTLMKLSGLIQYMLYETDEERVAVKTEAEYLQSYIDLQKQRFGSKVRVTFQLSLADDWSEIEPMLLIPFVENAFKHGIGMIESPEISIFLKTNRQKELFFHVKNKYNSTAIQIKDKMSGIGLNNVKRRLSILYPDTHKLSIDKENEVFEVTLNLKLR